MKTCTNNILICCILAFMLFPVSGITSASKIQNQNYNVICGYGNYNEGYLKITKQTTKIPYITKVDDLSFHFGCNIISEDITFTVKAEVTPPYIDKFNANHDYTIDKDYKTVTLSPITGSGQVDLGLQLDKEDPSGIYIIKIFVNEKLIRTISFDVSKKYNQ